MELRFSFPLRRVSSPFHIQFRQYSKPALSPPQPPSQALPLGDYYTSILKSSQPSNIAKAITSDPAATQIINHSTSFEPSILFSSPLSSPLKRCSKVVKNTSMLAGVNLPPKPKEPDNCCMSGCVNCVWERYRDELEEWVLKKRVADRILNIEHDAEWVRVRNKRRRDGKEDTEILEKDRNEPVTELRSSADGDRVSSETPLDSNGRDEGHMDESLFEGIPVGIREFMKQEKRLKLKRMRQDKGVG